MPNVLVVNKDVKATSVKELIDLMKGEPGTYNYGSSGLGTPPHLSGELFKMMAGVEIVHVPYNGGGPAMTDLVGGQIPVLFDVLTGATSFIRSDAVRALAVTTKERSPSFPDIPTVAESGLPEYETYTWNAVIAPAGLPQAVVDFYNAKLVKVVNDPTVKGRLIELNAVPVGSSSDALAEQVMDETAKWAPIIMNAGLAKQ